MIEETEILHKDYKKIKHPHKKKKEWALVIKHCTVSYSMTRFHVSIERRNWNKQIQTAILKVNTSEDIQKKVYTFFFSLLYGFYNQVWFQRKTKMASAGALTLKWLNFMRHFQASAIRTVKMYYYLTPNFGLQLSINLTTTKNLYITLIFQITGRNFYTELHFKRGLGRIVLGKYIFSII